MILLSYLTLNFTIFCTILSSARAANWRLEDRWGCGGDGCAIMRYGYPGLPCALTPGHKRDTITSVKSEQQKEKKAPEILLSNISLLLNKTKLSMYMPLSLSLIHVVEN